MAEHPNAALVRKLMDDMNSGSPSVEDAIDDNIIWREIGRAEPRRGKAELRALMAPGATDYTLNAKLHDVVANDDHTVALIEATGTRNGKTLTYHVAEIYHIKDGKITERWPFSDDTAAITAFFA